MNFLGIFDFFIIEDANLDSKTDWLSIFVGAIISALIAWLTVHITLTYQKFIEKQKQIILDYNRRESLIELNKKINSSIQSQLKHLKKGLRNKFFGSGKPNSTYIFNTIGLNTLDKFDIEQLFETISDLNFNNDERSILINFKLSLEYIRDAFNTLASQNMEDSKQIESMSKETDFSLSDAFSDLQKIILQFDGKRLNTRPSLLFPTRPSYLFPSRQVIISKIEAETYTFIKTIDKAFIKYHKTYFNGPIRLHQLILLKGVLKTIRKYQHLKLVDAKIAQKITTSFEMIKREKTKFKLMRKTNLNYLEVINKEYLKITAFSRLLKYKHRKNSLNNLKKQNKLFKINPLS